MTRVSTGKINYTDQKRFSISFQFYFQFSFFFIKTAQVVDVNTGAILPANERGELYFRGPQLMQGYVDKTATKEVLDKDGWYKTGTYHITWKMATDQI